jgi:hypothetical protein
VSFQVPTLVQNFKKNLRGGYLNMVRKGKAAGGVTSNLPVVIPPQEGGNVQMPGMLASDNPLQAAAMDFSDILNKPDLTPGQRRRLALQKLGLIKPKKVYASPADRKAASKLRAKERRQAKLAALPEEFRPRPKVKRSPEEKKERRKERGKEKRMFLREMAQKDPSLAAKYGIHVELFKVNRKPKKAKKSKNK